MWRGRDIKCSGVGWCKGWNSRFLQLSPQPSRFIDGFLFPLPAVVSQYLAAEEAECEMLLPVLCQGMEGLRE